jgi:hypothetical protein
VKRNRQSSTNTAGLERLVVFRAEIEVDGIVPGAGTPRHLRVATMKDSTSLRFKRNQNTGS